MLIDNCATSCSTVVSAVAAAGSGLSARPLDEGTTGRRSGGSGAGDTADAPVAASAATRSICCTLSGAMAMTSTPSGQGRVDSTTASSPKAWRTSCKASREVRALKRLTFMS